MHARFYAPTLTSGGSSVELPREEAEHLGRVLRLGVGDEVHVFDGRGSEYRGRVELVERARVRVALDGPVTPAAESRVTLTLAQAVLKGDGMDRVVRDAVMLGAAAIVPLVTDRAEVDARRIAAAGRVARWQRIAVASVKQCGRAVVPAIHEPHTLEACLRAFDAPRRYLLAEPGLLATPPVSARALAGEPAPGSALLVVGPEGGWTRDEVALADSAGCVPLSLGPRTLRADAAAAVGISVLQCVWGEMEEGTRR
jgi:16S rRNA (uracil1498-N3)-methyltransferase